MRKRQKMGLNQLRTKRSGVRVPPGAPRRGEPLWFVAFFCAKCGFTVRVAAPLREKSRSAARLQAPSLMPRCRYQLFAVEGHCSLGIYFITLTQGFSQESCGSWDFSFSGKRLSFSRFTHNLRTTFSKRTAKGEKQARLGSASRLSFCLSSPAPMLSSEAPHPQCTGWRLHRPGQPYSQTSRKRRPGLFGWWKPSPGCPVLPWRLVMFAMCLPFLRHGRKRFYATLSW